MRERNVATGAAIGCVALMAAYIQRLASYHESVIAAGCVAGGADRNGGDAAAQRRFGIKRRHLERRRTAKAFARGQNTAALLSDNSGDGACGSDASANSQAPIDSVGVLAYMATTRRHGARSCAARRRRWRQIKRKLA